MIIREASPSDVDGITRVHLASWRSTYKGIIPESYLSSLTYEKRKKNWIWTFHNLNEDERIFVAEYEGQIIGFSSGGKNRIDNTNFDGELYAIYILKQFQGKGIGKKLMEEIRNSLKERNYKGMMAWVLESNPAINFYKKLGGKEFERKEIKRGENVFIEVALGWNDLKEIESV